MNNKVQPGRLFLISAPSGAGKTSLVDALIENVQKDPDGQLCVSVSHTTRDIRSGEKDGINYHFISPAKFTEMRQQEDFLEHAEVFGNFYGTSKPWVESQLAEGWDVILEIDWQGAAQVQALMPAAIGIFILPPSLETLRDRLTQRGQDDTATIESRMAQAVNEISHYQQAHYLIINDNFNVALASLKDIIKQPARCENLRTSSQQTVLQELIRGLLS